MAGHTTADMYGSIDIVKEMKKLTDTTNDAELQHALIRYSDIIDMYLTGLDTNAPYNTSTAPPILTHIANILGHGEFEICHGDRDKGFARFNFGWSLFDNYTMLTYGVKARERKSSKIGGGGGWQHGSPAV